LAGRGTYSAARLAQVSPGRVRPGPGAPASPPPAEEVDVAQHPVIGYLVWVVLFGALFAWEGLALSHISGVPTLSDAFRVIMRYPFARWALFALWLWFGWHIFIRGWHFLLRA
jgi:Family of unknown function (DUF6186)